MSRSRIERGRQTELIYAEYLREHGYPHALASAASARGDDISNVGILEPEVKATAGVPFLSALAQAEKRTRGGLPYVVWRPNGYGPEKIDLWVVGMRLGRFHKLLESG